MSDLTVMIVDDDADFRFLTRKILEREGIEVVAEASDGREALEVFATLDPPPDIVVLDQLMPGMEGIDAAAELLSRSEDACVVLLTATMVDRRLRNRAADVGILAVLSKANLELLPRSLVGCHRDHRERGLERTSSGG